MYGSFSIQKVSTKGPLTLSREENTLTTEQPGFYLRMARLLLQDVTIQTIFRDYVDIVEAKL